MQGSTLVRWLIVAVLAFFIWRWWSEQRAHNTIARSEQTTPAMNCVFEARQANDYWGAHIHQFANPPYDTQAWDTFKSEVESRLFAADGKCRCSDSACTKSIEAMNELRTMLSEVDSAVRSGEGAPTDLVQRQERVDQALDAAKDAAR